MKKLILKKVAQLVRNIFGKKTLSRFILFLSRVGQINLLTFAYNEIGILNPGNYIVSGESFVIKNILKKETSGKEQILFDIGANKGNYAEMLCKELPESKIFAFEPNFRAYEILKRKFADRTVKVLNKGLGSDKSVKKIYSYAEDSGSSHSSTFKEVFTKIHQVENLTEMDFACTTIDDFCAENKIDEVDFIKIDTEGGELDILKGARRMLKENRIKFIQFEFNEMNVVSRVFLKDFYEILGQYELFRLHEKGLIPLGSYNPKNEIFQFQNILAINHTASQNYKT
ncbi:MAG: FkbM family methyltransferase [bacterium]|nr:FkbM family methyltransferase [bacterium]